MKCLVSFLHEQKQNPHSASDKKIVIKSEKIQK